RQDRPEDGGGEARGLLQGVRPPRPGLHPRRRTDGRRCRQGTGGEGGRERGGAPVRAVPVGRRGVGATIVEVATDRQAASDSIPTFRRVLLKLSGDAFAPRDRSSESPRSPRSPWPRSCARCKRSASKWPSSSAAETAG